MTTEDIAVTDAYVPVPVRFDFDEPPERTERRRQLTSAGGSPQTARSAREDFAAGRSTT
jgi:hypothetical protein